MELGVYLELIYLVIKAFELDFSQGFAFLLIKNIIRLFSPFHRSRHSIAVTNNNTGHTRGSSPIVKPSGSPHSNCEGTVSAPPPPTYHYRQH